MARVTVEDCLQVVPNRFELALIAKERARNLMAGAPQIREGESGKKEKYTVIALREIADKLLDIDTIKESLKKGAQKQEVFEKTASEKTEGKKAKEKETATTFDLEEELDSIVSEKELKAERAMFADENIETEN